MSRSRTFRSFMVDGRMMTFSPDGLNAAIERVHSSTGATRGSIHEQIATACFVSEGSVKNWKYGHNGPDTLDIIKKAAEILQTDYLTLLEEQTQEMKDNHNVLYNPINTDSEKEFINQYYQRLVDYAYDYIGTNELCYKNEISEEFDYDFVEFNLYRTLDKAALYISSETYDKLHRITTELVSFLPPWIFFPERWLQINSRMRIVDYLIMDAEYLYDLNDIDEEKYDEFLKEYLDETGYSLKDAMEHTDRVKAYTYVSREVARTIKLLFQQEFKGLL